MLSATMRRLPSSLLVALILSFAPAAHADAGDLDPAFGNGGKVLTDFDGLYDAAADVVVQPDGKILVAGEAVVIRQNGAAGIFFAVARYLPDGSLDQTFGGTGKVTIDFDSPYCQANALVLQPNGKIILAGTIRTSTYRSFPSDLALARFNPDGSLDPSFGDGGKVKLDGGRGLSVANDVALQPDGKIVVVGICLRGVPIAFTFARLNADGSLDSGAVEDSTPRDRFGDAGFVAVDGTDTPDSVVIQADGKIVGAGTGSNDFQLVRLQHDGAVDNSFGHNGIVVTDFANSRDSLFDLALQPDGKLVAAGATFIPVVDEMSKFALARYNSDGTLDSSFDGGKLTTKFDHTYSAVYSVAVQPNGKIIAAGAGGEGLGFVLARYNADGDLDTQFAGTGQLSTSFGGTYDAATGIAIQKDGKIIAVGAAGDAGDFALARFLGSTPFTVSGRVTSGGRGLPGVAVNVSGERSGVVITDVSGSYSLMNLPSGENYTVTPLLADHAFAPQSRTFTNLDGNATADFAALTVVQFATSSVSVDEAAHSVSLEVKRTGDLSINAVINYRTVDHTAAARCDDTTSLHGVALARCDYATTVNTITFMPGEERKIVSVPLVDDAHVEPDETFQVLLDVTGTGATLGARATLEVKIRDNDVEEKANPIFNTQFFVRQQYLDFLSREPEVSEPWTAVLNRCPNVKTPPSTVTDCDRIAVSAAFFGSPEYRLKGFYVFRFYKVAFNRLPEYREIVSDMSFVAGATEAEVYARKAQLAAAFVARQEFTNAYSSKSNAEYVAGMLSRYQLDSVRTHDPAAPDDATKVTLTATDLTNALNAGTLTRAQVLRAIADSDQVAAAEYNRAFVAAQYYGYLRRTPEDSGYRAWLRVIDQDPNDVRIMIDGFMNSTEYRLRFGQP